MPLCVPKLCAALVLVAATAAIAESPVCEQAAAWFRERNWSEAAKGFQQCEIENPGKTDALLYRGKALVNVSDFAAAESSLESYITAHPASDDALYLLGFVHFRRDHPRESLETFARGAKLKPPRADDLKIAALDYVLLEDYSNAARYLEESLKINPNDIEALYHLGRVRYQLQQFDLAISAFNELLRRDPENVKAQDNLGLCLEATNQTEAAMAAYRKAIGKQSGALNRSEQPYLNLGKLLITQNRAADAIPLLSQAVSIAPQSASAHYELGRAEFTIGQIDDARSQLEQAVKLDPENSSIHYFLGRIYKRTGQSEAANKEFKLTEELVRQHNKHSGGMASSR